MNERMDEQRITRRSQIDKSIGIGSYVTVYYVFVGETSVLDGVITSLDDESLTLSDPMIEGKPTQTFRGRFLFPAMREHDFYIIDIV